MMATIEIGRHASMWVDQRFDIPPDTFDRDLTKEDAMDEASRQATAEACRWANIWGRPVDVESRLERNGDDFVAIYTFRPHCD